MFDKVPYTPGMREVFKLSKAEAGRLRHEYTGPEHYLLAIIRKGDGLAVQTLQILGIDLEDLKMELERIIEPGSGTDIRFWSPNDEARRVLDSTKEIARQMKHNWIGTEHLLLGLIKEENTVAAKCLRHFDVDFSEAQKEVLNVIDGSNSVPHEILNVEARSVLKNAKEIARRMNRKRIGPEHLLLGLIKEEDTVAAKCLRNFGVDFSKAQNEIVNVINETNSAPQGHGRS